MDKDQINKWLAEGKITQEQATMMIEENEAEHKEKSSNKFITTISVLGSIFLGLGVIWVVAANWDGMPDILKIVVLLGSTFGLLYLGYEIGFHKKSLPRTGHSLVLLAAIMFGASIFLIAQIYNVEANASFLTLIWLMGIIPLVYIFQSPLLAVLSCIVFCIWFNTLIISNIDDINIPSLLFFYETFGILLFALGGLHYFMEKYAKVARAYRLLGIYLTLPILFIFTFKYVYLGLQDMNPEFEMGTPMMIGIYAVATIMLLINLKYNPSKSKTNLIENVACLIILNVLFIFNLTLKSNISYLIFWAIFNILFIGLIVLLFRIGFNRMDMRLVNIASMNAFGFIVFKFFDIFAGLLNNGITWIIFGVLLLAGSILFEKKRREIRERFKKASASSQANG